MFHPSVVLCMCLLMYPFIDHRKSVKKINLIGRRVVMSADVFGGKANEVYHGVVARKGRYIQSGKTKHGYFVKWHDGDEDMWYVYNTHSHTCTHTHAHTCTRTHAHTHAHMHTLMHTYTHMLTHAHTNTPRSYRELLPCLVDETDDQQRTFVDADWVLISKVQTVEPIDEFPAGYRDATLYQLRSDPKQVCLFFGNEEYEGLDPPYTLVDGVVRDGDGDEVKLVCPLKNSIAGCSKQIETDLYKLMDPELEELEEDGGGYLSDSSDSDFLFGGDGDQKIIYKK